MPNTTLLSPLELSAQAISKIEAHPASHNQSVWHHPCGTAHCYAGHIDLILGVPDEYKERELYNDVRVALQLNYQEWCRIVHANNSIDRIRAFHKMYFVDGVFGIDGRDKDGYDIDGLDRNGLDKD